MISGIETRGSGGSMNQGPKLLWAPSLGANNFMQDQNTILYVDSEGRWVKIKICIEFEWDELRLKITNLLKYTTAVLDNIASSSSSSYLFSSSRKNNAITKKTGKLNKTHQAQMSSYGSLRTYNTSTIWNTKYKTHKKHIPRGYESTLKTLEKRESSMNLQHVHWKSQPLYVKHGAS